MSALQRAIGLAWICFGTLWLLFALAAKPTAGGRWRFPWTTVSVLVAFGVLRFLPHTDVSINSQLVADLGAATFGVGLALALWARVYLGRNWGMPMSERVEPELVTGGPYRFVRHPIYAGLLLGVVGTALATDFVGMIGAVILGVFFTYAATVEERKLATAFPTTYPQYRERTKMLIPFLL